MLHDETAASERLRVFWEAALAEPCGGLPNLDTLRYLTDEAYAELVPAAPVPAVPFQRYMLGPEEVHVHGPADSERLRAVLAAVDTAAARSGTVLEFSTADTTSVEAMHPTRDYLRPVEARRYAVWAEALSVVASHAESD
ncbi:hypothetical protein [Kitasatospora sp. NPDC001527]|uniref:hypothetical protein n=1 Tax=Kitasatospora sp. NPDC001527 TaxID=3154519 RepID=UPI0033165388